MSATIPAPSVNNLRRDLERQRERLQVALDARSDVRLAELLAEVDQALGRIESGGYGICEICHESIGPKAIATDPCIRFCLDHLSEAEQRRLESDLELAARVQSRLLPEPRIELGGWEVAHRYEPMGPVGGDYCDVVRAAGNSFYFFLGDVSGKGVAASLLAAQLHGLFRTLVVLDLPLETMVERANRVFSESILAGHFATLICGHAFPDGAIDFINAGHPPPLVIRAGRAHPIERGGHPLGLFSDGNHQTERLELAPGESLLLYTDGLSESTGPSNEEYGWDRAAVAAAGSREKAEEIVEACVADAARFRASAPRTDDLTVMALRRID